MKIKRYSIDLSAQMAACDGNFIRILKLLPDMRAGVSREIAIPGGGGQSIVFVMEVVESFKYTSTVCIRQCVPGEQGPWYEPPEMQLRIYHDAKTAEVVSYQNHRHFKAIYPVPNPRMYHPNEKDQLNHFLTDWLNLCLEKGVSNRDLFTGETYGYALNY